MTRRGLLLDFDGVIVDSEPAHAAANGVRSAAAAGVRVVGLVGAFDEAALREAGAHATARSLAELTADPGRLRDA